VVYGYYQSIELSLKRDSAGLDSGTIIVHREWLLSTFKDSSKCMSNLAKIHIIFPIYTVACLYNVDLFIETQSFMALKSFLSTI